MSAGADTLALVPGVRRLRPDDHFMILAETDATPMHIGALILLDIPVADRSELTNHLRRQFEERLPATPLLCRLVEAPDGFDSPVWADLAAADLAAHIVEEPGASVNDAVARLNLERLDLSRPPFRVHVFPDVGAFYFKMHHAVADGIGFQEVMRRLSDEAAPADARRHDAIIPAPSSWQVLSQARFVSEAGPRDEKSAARRAAFAALELLKGERAETPVLKLSRPTSRRRSYTNVSLELSSFRHTAKALDATINDLLLACVSWALRDYLLDIDDCPATPLVVNAARSYRQEEHGLFGNRIVALHPHLGTHIADPVERMRAIQSSMAGELRRTSHDEALLDMPEKPYGARDRTATFADRSVGGARILPGNLTISNVPGPSEPLRWCGYRQLHNYPVPIIGSGRFLNFTSRRSGANLDIGIIADPDMITNVGKIAARFRYAVQAYAAMR